MRSRASRLSVCGIAGSLLWVVLACTADRPEPGRKGLPVLLITVDGLVAADLDAFGGSRPMPHLRHLVEQSVSWPRALSAVPMTRPAVATYLTGVAPDRHGVRDDLFASLPTGLPTLAERLAEAGYRTAAFPDSSFLAERSGLWRGFELVDRPPAVVVSASRWLPRVRPASLTSEAVSTWLAGLEEGVAWFGWVHLSYPLVGQFKQNYSVAGNS